MTHFAFKITPCDESVHRTHGFDVDFLTSLDSLKNPQTFFTLLQCQTDRLAEYYEKQEKHIFKHGVKKVEKVLECLLAEEEQSKRDEDKARILILIEADIRQSILNLQRFLAESIDKYVRVLRAYDKHHGTSIEKEELKQLEAEHSFIDGHRLRAIKRILNKMKTKESLGIEDNGSIVVCIEQNRSRRLRHSATSGTESTSASSLSESRAEIIRKAMSDRYRTTTQCSAVLEDSHVAQDTKRQEKKNQEKSFKRILGVSRFFHRKSASSKNTSSAVATLS